MTDRGILVMAYGTPRDLDGVEAYYTDIRHGRPPEPEAVEELKDRYRAIGGRSPLLELTTAQAEGIADRVGVPAYVGQKHAAPFIPDAIARMQKNGVTTAVGLVLAPHFSRMSIGDYERRARNAAEELGWHGELRLVESWHLEPGYISLLAGRVREASAELGNDDAVVVFTAHSLPERILQAKDPYPDQLRETAEAVASAAGVTNWRVGWQSAGRTADKWLGPDLLEILDDEASKGTKAIVACPCGFVADHLEVLYDIDIEAQEHATKLGIQLTRTASPNVDPRFLDTLAEVVRKHL
jgi:ferrochelatase